MPEMQQREMLAVITSVRHVTSEASAFCDLPRPHQEMRHCSGLILSRGASINTLQVDPDWARLVTS